MNPGPALPIIDVGAFSRSTRKRSAAIRAVTGALTRSGFMYGTWQQAVPEVDCFASCVSAERPAQYPRITAGEHIRRKIAATNEWLK